VKPTTAPAFRFDADEMRKDLMMDDSSIHSIDANFFV
jgi:hypothetical protein